MPTVDEQVDKYFIDADEIEKREETIKGIL